jgi:hypothetical protein
MIMNLTADEQQRILAAAEMILGSTQLSADDLIASIEIVGALAKHHTGVNVLLTAAIGQNPLILPQVVDELGIQGLAERLISKEIKMPIRQQLVDAQKQAIERKMKEERLG